MALLSFFAANQTVVNSTSNLFVTVHSNDTTLTGISMGSVSLPPGLTIVSTSSSCATISSTSTSFSFSGGSASPGGECGVQITVKAASPGSYSFTSAQINSTQAALGTVSAFSPLQVYLPTSATQAIASKTLTQNQPSTSFTPVTGSGGVPSLSYSISPALPSGLSIDSATGTISGTPTATLGATTFTVTVADGQAVGFQSIASNTFTLTVNAAVTAAQQVASKTFTVNQAIAAFTPVAGGGGTGSLTYSISPALPAGLAFSTSNGQISGTPTAASANTTYTVTVTDVNGASASNTFQMLVNLNQPTTTVLTSSASAVATGSTLTYTATVTSGASPMTSGTVTFKDGATTVCSSVAVNTSGVATCTASALTTGTHALSAAYSGTTGFATSSGTVTVYAVVPPTISAAFASSPITNNASTTLTVTVKNPSANTVSLGNVSFSSALTGLTGATLQSSTCPNGSVGSSISASAILLSVGSSCSVIATIPAGQAVGTYDFTPAAPSSGLANGSAVAQTGVAGSQVSLVVNANPLSATQSVSSATVTAGFSITTFKPVFGSGGYGTLSYALYDASGTTPASLPAGLSLNPATGQISGTPTALLANTQFTIVVSDQTTPTAQTASSTFNLTVNPGPLNTAVTAGSLVFTAGTAATPSIPVTGSGGFGSLTYALLDAAGTTPATLPSGLSFSTSSGQISGTPSALLATTSFTVSVSDQATPTAQVSSKTFTLTVNPAALNTAVNIPSTTLTAGTAASAFAPVSGSGGFGSLTYALFDAAGTTPATLPAGLSFSTSSGQISGTPSALLGTTTFTVTVTDQATPTAQTSSKTFQLAVDPAPLSASVNAASTTLTANTAVTPFTPVAGSGGFGTLTYALYDAGGTTPATLPSGLSFSVSSGEIAGTPSITLATTTFTVKVTDQATPSAQSASASFVLAVVKQPTTLVLSSSSSTPQLGQSITLTATTTPSGISGGFVSFTDGVTVLCASQAVSAGTASCSARFLTTGPHAVSAAFTGDATHGASTAASITLNVKDSVGPATQAIGGFISDRGNQIVSNMFDMSRGMDRLNEAQGNSNAGSSTQLADGPAPAMQANAQGFGAARMMAGGMGLPVAAAQGGMADFYGLQSMLRDAMQNAGQSGSLDRLAYSGPFDLSVNAHEGFAASFHTSLSQMMKWQDAALGLSAPGHGHGTYSPFDIWMEGTYAGYGGERSGTFGLVSMGGDYVVNPNLLIGVFTQIDMMNQTSGTPVNGTGWMAGPYATARLHDNLFWNGRAAFGTSGNTLSGSGDFTSTRWLASTSLSGVWNLGPQFTVKPDLSFTYFTDTTNAYSDTFGVTIPSVKTELGQLKLSPALTYAIATDGGYWVEPSLTPELIWNFASTNVQGLGVLSDTATGPTGLRGRIKAGLSLKTPGGASIGAFGSYDGIGATGYSALAVQAQVNVPLK